MLSLFVAVKRKLVKTFQDSSFTNKRFLSYWFLSKALILLCVFIEFSDVLFDQVSEQNITYLNQS